MKAQWSRKCVHEHSTGVAAMKMLAHGSGSVRMVHTVDTVDPGRSEKVKCGSADCLGPCHGVTVETLHDSLHPRKSIERFLLAGGRQREQ